MGQLNRRTPSSRGLLQPFDLRLPGAPLPRREPLPIPSGAVVFPVRSPSRPRIALQRSSAVPARCLESVSTTDVHVTSTRLKHPFRRLPSSAVGNPPTFDFETAPSFVGFRLRRSSGAGPPRGHPTSDGCTLDGVPAGFGPVDHLFSRGLSRRAPVRLFAVREGSAPWRFLRREPLPTRTL